jgi:hypothetical protein
VTPQQTETLQISAAPALGAQALASASASPSPTATPEVITKVTETKDKDGKITSTVTEKTLKPATQVTIYDLYEKFVRAGYLSDAPTQPRKGDYVPGTLKRWGTQCYYIKTGTPQGKYYRLCKDLFTKGQAGSVERTLQQVQASAAFH